MDLKSIFAITKKGVIDNAPTILSALGAVGVVSTAVLAAKATPQAKENLAEDIRKNGNYTGRRNKIARHIKSTWRPYAPAALSAISSIVCIAAAQRTNLRRQAALIGAYTVSQETLREYREEAKELLGIKKSQELNAKVAEKKTKDNPPNESNTIIFGNGEAIIYDAFSGRYLKGDIELVRKAVNDFNQVLIANSYASLNTFYEFLGLEPTQMGEEFGFKDGNLLDIEFDAHLNSENRPCLMMRYEVYPTKDYWKNPFR